MSYVDNKVNWGLCRLGVAPLTVDPTTGAYTYAAIIMMPGAVNMAAAAKGEVQSFEADNVEYYTTANNDGYDIELEVANIPDEIMDKIVGMVEDTNHLELEYGGVEYPHFALLGQFEGDKHKKRFAFYDCVVAERPEFAGETSKAKAPKTRKMKISARPRLIDDLVKSSTRGTTSETVYNAWFTTVQVPVLAGA